MPHDPNASSALTLTRPTQLDIFVHCGGAMAQVATRLADGPLQWEQPLEVEDLEDLYAWIDTVPLSKPKRAFARDFSDGGARREAWWKNFLIARRAIGLGRLLKVA